MIVLTVATHSQNLYPYLCESAERFGFALRTLGWGDTYTSHTQKDDLVLRACEEVSDPEELVCFVDGFDTLLCATPAELEAAYRSIAGEKKNILLVSVDGAPRDMRAMRYPVWAYSYWRTFGSRLPQGCYRNAGMFLGPAGSIVQWLRRVRPYAAQTRSNQLAWARCLADGHGSGPDHEVIADVDSKLFYNYFALFAKDGAIVGQPSGRVVRREGPNPLVVSLPAFRDARPLLTQMHGEGQDVLHRTTHKWGWLAKGKVYLRGFALEIGVAAFLLGSFWTNIYF